MELQLCLVNILKIIFKSILSLLPLHPFSLSHFLSTTATMTLWVVVGCVARVPTGGGGGIREAVEVINTFELLSCLLRIRLSLGSNL